MELVQSDALEFSTINGKGIKKLTGHVILKQDQAVMRCDSAYLDDVTNSFEGFGHVLITQGDSLELSGETITYYGNEKTADIKKQVSMRHGNMVLKTEELHYDMTRKVANYPTPGKIIEGSNTLSSLSGMYEVGSKMMSFQKKVVFINPDYRMITDTMKYNTESEVSYFFGPTYIISQTDTIYCENGWYDTKTEKSQFSKKAWIHTGSQWIKADSLIYSRKTGIGKAFRNIWIKDTSEGFILFGQRASYKSQQKEALVTGNAMAMKISGIDTFYVWADSLFYVGDTVKSKRFLLAYHHAFIFKNDLQSAADSLAYLIQDSLVTLYGNPVLWNEENQMTADTISFLIKGGQPDGLELKSNAFIASKEAEGRFNQIKGDQIRGFFSEGKLCRVRIFGNGESVYYAKEDSGGYFGVNKATCTDMLIVLKEQKVSKIVMYHKPSGTLFPIEGTDPKKLLLKGFEWKDGLRPKQPEDLIFPILSRPKR